MFKKFRLFTIFTACFGFMAFFNVAYAKIEVTVDRTYTVNETNQLSILEVHTIFNDTENQYIPADEVIKFQILGFRIDDPDESEILNTALQSSSILEGGIDVTYETKFEDNRVILEVPYKKDVLPGQSRTFSFQYSHPGLVYRNGSIIDIYIHAFSNDFQFDNETTNYTFNTELIVPTSLNDVNFISPNPTIIEESTFVTTYKFDQSLLIDQFVWLQLGRSQIYDFVITQEILPTENKLTGLQNRFELILPRNFESDQIVQEVIFRSIEPEPESIREDSEGNLIGIFEFPSNIDSEIRVSGYAFLEKRADVNFREKVSNLDNISPVILSKYTKEADFWEVNAAEIQNQTKELVENDENVFIITSKIYNFIVDSIDYSQVKRFGLNQRQGALQTLRGGAAVCMEYSDLFLTMMRAKGVPTRAVFGYGYSPRIASDKQEAHQWVQVYMPGLENNWIDVDVTWGESGEILIGGDLNHFYTHVAYEDPNSPSMISRLAYGGNSQLNPPEFNITTKADIEENKETLLDSKDLLDMFPYEEESSTEFFVVQIALRYQAGFQSLKDGIDFENASQVLVIVTLTILSVLILSLGGSLFSKNK